MDGINLNTQLAVLAILIVVAVFFVYSNSFNNDVPSCDGYVTNVYWYVLLGLLITCFSIVFIAKRGYPITTTKSLIAIAVAIVMIFGLYMVNPSQVVLNHVLWLMVLVAVSVAIYNIWRYSSYRGTVTSTLLVMTIMVVMLIGVAHFNPELIDLNWGTTLITLLVAGVLAWFAPMIVSKDSLNTAYYKMLSAAFTVLFMALILYDTKLLRVKASKCVYPDYPADSLNMFLDITNLFGSMSFIR